MSTKKVNKKYFNFSSKIMNDNEKKVVALFPRSYIAPISIELPNYDFYHSPYETSIPDSRFIGRHRLREKFRELLIKNKTKSGAYLITGFRGMGKTSFVKRVLKDVIYDDDCKSDLSLSSLAKQFVAVLFIWIIINSLACIIYDTDLDIVTLMPVWYLFALIGIFWSILNIHNEYVISGYYIRVHKDALAEERKMQIKIRKKLEGIFVFDSLLGKYKFRKRVGSSIVTMLILSLLILATIILVDDKVYLAWNYMSGDVRGIVVDLALILIVLRIAGAISIWLLQRLLLFSRRVLRRGIQKCIIDILDTMSPHSIKPDYIEISLGFDSVTERDVYVSIIGQLRKKLNAWRNNYRFRDKQVMILIVSLFIAYNTPLLDTFRTQVRKSKWTRDFFPALYDPQNNFNIEFKESFDSYHDRLKGEYLKDKSGSSNGDINMDGTASSRVVVQDLNASRADIAIDNGRQSVFITFINGIEMLHANVNFGFGLPLSYHTNRVSLLLLGKQSYSYYFFIWLSFAWFLLYNIAYWFYSSVIFKYSKIYSKIKELDLRAYAGFTSAIGGETASRFKLSLQTLLGRATSVQYNVATAKEMESELLQVLRLINDRAQRGLMPHYLIIMDEVDKVDPHSNFAISELAAETRTNGKNNEDSVADSSRRRQQAVFHLLSNLKHFFTTADTQFVFIAGQELFDASLADVSDRNYFLGSVFNQVINIESFYSDLSDKQNSNITSMIESYLCTCILPEWYIKEKSHKIKAKADKDRLSEFPTLADYREYVEKYLLLPIMYSIDDKQGVKNILDLYEEKAEVKGKYKSVKESIDSGKSKIDISIFDQRNKHPKAILNGNELKLERIITSSKEYTAYEQRKAKITKLISQLYAFTVYLAYRSNGAPKKISALLDENVFPHEAISNQLAIDNARAHLLMGHSKNNLYLHLGFNLQYNINLITYLVSPVLFSLNTSLRDYGDKLLIGASFIFDHIMKFHKTGFSQSDLDLMPEFIDINRAPEMRSLISRIIDNLKENYLDEVHSGLFDFTFNRKLVEEINYLSKINDKESAAFNFTLDESLRMKQYLYSKITQLKKPNTSYNNDGTSFPDSGLFTSHYIESQLGDLHFYDNEFIDAIIQYKNSITYIRQKDIKSMDYSQFINYIKTMLKIGLTFEKLGNNDKALAYYEETTFAVIVYRDIDLSKFGLHEVYIERPENSEDWDKILDMANEYEKLAKTFNSNGPEWKTRLVHMLDPKLWHNEGVRNKTIFKLRKLGKGERLNFIVRLANYQRAYITSIEPLYDIPLISGDSVVVDRSVNFWNFLMNSEFSVLYEKYLGRSSMFENLQLFYLPLIAKLQVVERAYLGGVVLSDILRVLKEYRFLSKILRKNEELFIQTEFYRKLANVLFFKNSSFSFCDEVKENPDDDLKFTVKHQNVHQLYELLDIDQESLICYTKTLNSKCRPKEQSCSADACLVYLNNLYKIIDNEMWKLPRQKVELPKWDLLLSGRQQSIQSIFTELTLGVENFYSQMNPVMWNNIALNVSYLGDTICSCKAIKDQESCYLNNISSCFQEMMLEKTHSGDNLTLLMDFVSLDAPNMFDLIFKAYVLSALIYMKTGNYRGECFAYKKILYLIQWSGIELTPMIRYFCTNYLFSRSIDCLLLSQGSIHRMEIQKIKNRIMDKAYINSDLIDLRLTTIFADAQEYVVTYENFNLWQAYKKIRNISLKRETNRKDVIVRILIEYKIDLLSYFISDLNSSSIQLTHNVILSHINNSLLNRIVYTILDLVPSWNDFQDLTSECAPNLFQEEYVAAGRDGDYVIIALKMRAILDGLFSIHNAIKHVNVNGITYKTNYSFLGNLYHYMHNWCKNFHEVMIVIREKGNLERYQKLECDIDANLSSLFSGEYNHLISTLYYVTKSLEHYKMAVDTHNGGDHYRQIISGMHFLQEDFCSDTYHFFAALDRFILNSEKFKERIDNLNKENEDTIINKYKYYSVPSKQ